MADILKKLETEGWAGYTVKSNNKLGELCDPSTCPCYHGCMSALGEGRFPKEGKKVCYLVNMKMPTPEEMIAILDWVKEHPLIVD